MALTKANLAARLYGDIGLNKREARDIVEDLFEEIRAALESGRSGQPVKLFGFGNLDLRDINARLGRNPKTGEDAVISARRVVAFHPGAKLREQVEGYSEKDGG
ncbi:MAG: integration host factor subunit alpha [Deltaproteobacteria bacterium]|nr:integration host factor subunit alpha [Deltaproteobacteria bacterium]